MKAKAAVASEAKSPMPIKLKRADDEPQLLKELREFVIETTITQTTCELDEKVLAEEVANYLAPLVKRIERLEARLRMKKQPKE